METTTTRNAVKKFYAPGKNFWLSRHDACALYKALDGKPYLSKSVCKRLRKGLWNEILKPLYLYTMHCSQCGCELKTVYDKEMTIKEVEALNRTDHMGTDLGVICGRCLEDYK